MNTECSEGMDSSDQSSTGNGGSSMETQVCVVGKPNTKNEELMQDLKSLNLQILTSETGQEILRTLTDNVEIAFVCDPFEGEDFENIRREEQRIIGPPVVHDCAKKHLRLPYNSRPLFCRIMDNHVICFTGFRDKEKLTTLCDLVHHMGGSVRREFSGRVTHLVANTIQGQKYRTAVSLGKHIMTEEWIHKCWERKNDVDIDTVQEEMRKYRVMPFFGCFLAFYGFSDEEKRHMEESTEQQGGTHVCVDDSQCSHIVVADGVQELPNELKNDSTTPKRPTVVKQEWFWASIHMDACADQSLYRFKDEVLQSDILNQDTPTSGRKRKRRNGKTLSDMLSPTDSLQSYGKRRSTDPLSISSSLLDITLVSPATPIRLDETPSGTILTPISSKSITARQQVAMELLQTEKNYVGILTTILKVFKEPLEDHPRGGPIIPPESIKSIFGSLPDILQVHTEIMKELDWIVSNWTEDRCIGNVILKHADELTKVYPPFVNYFEMSKETIVKCDRDVPRFHAFLMACLSKSECGRQTLAELLIRPVQRLPSIILLISDLIKRTKTFNPDHTALSQAVDALKKVMMFINEDKRKTEGQVQMFEILRDVDGCPANILSSHRVYVTKVDTYEMSDLVVGRGEAVTIFLFSDSLEVTKRRGVKPLPMKSPAAKMPQKPYKHIEFIEFKNIREIVDVRDNDDFQNLFGIKFLYEKKEAKDKKEKEVVFRLVGEDKKDWIDKLITGLSTLSCTMDKENYLSIKDPSDMSLSKSNMSNGTLSRAVRVARRTTRKVSRALSMNKTPRKFGPLRRAASSVTPNDVPGETSPLEPTTKNNQAQMGGGRSRASSYEPMFSP